LEAKELTNQGEAHTKKNSSSSKFRKSVGQLRRVEVSDWQDCLYPYQAQPVAAWSLEAKRVFRFESQVENFENLSTRSISGEFLIGGEALGNTNRLRDCCSASTSYAIDNV